MAAWIPAAISAGASLGGAYLASRGKKETKIQSQQRHLIDDLLNSLKGRGSYNDLFTASEEDFNRSFRDPAMARFRNQVTPQIQQGFIQSGQQRGTSLDDTLTRAGVDMDQLLNQHYMQYQQGAMDRRSGALNSILGQGAGAPRQMGAGEALGQGIGGYLSQPGAKDDISNIINSILGQKQQDDSRNVLTDTYMPQPKGFERDPQYYDPYSGVMR